MINSVPKNLICGCYWIHIQCQHTTLLSWTTPNHLSENWVHPYPAFPSTDSTCWASYVLGLSTETFHRAPSQILENLPLVFSDFLLYTTRYCYFFPVKSDPAFQLHYQHTPSMAKPMIFLWNFEHPWPSWRVRIFHKANVTTTDIVSDRHVIIFYHRVEYL